jgi:hypothetical protein
LHISKCALNECVKHIGERRIVVPGP